MPNVSKIKSHPQYDKIRQDLLRGAISPQASMTLTAIAKRYGIGASVDAGVRALTRFKKHDLFNEVAALRVVKQEYGKISPSTSVDEMLATLAETGRYAAQEAIKSKDFNSVVGLMEQGREVVASVARNRGRSIDALPGGLNENGHALHGNTSINIANLIATPKTRDGRLTRAGSSSDPVYEAVTITDELEEVDPSTLPEGLALGKPEE